MGSSRRIPKALIAASVFFYAGCFLTETTTQGVRKGRELSTVEIVRMLRPSVVRLQTRAARADLDRGLPRSGFGTGVIIDNQGHIVTNYHVVLGLSGESAPESILATLWDRRTYAAAILGFDERLDLAVLKIDASGLTAATFGDSGALEVGEDVVAIGFALNLDGLPTVTRGVVSGLRRRILEPAVVIPDAIQTDAGIHPGNSGGPLMNMRGEVIGINTAVVSGAPNIGFAVSASIVRPAVQSLIEKGKVERAYLGIATADSSIQIALGNLTGKGIPVMLVNAGSPAEKAGLRVRDIIVTVGGEDVSTGSDLLAILAKHRPGDRVVIEFHRGEGRSAVAVTLGQQPDGG